jgi:hypothetical protein
MTERLTLEHFLPHSDKTFLTAGGRHVLISTKIDARRVGRGTLYDARVDDPTFEHYVVPIQMPGPGRQDHLSSFD